MIVINISRRTPVIAGRIVTVVRRAVIIRGPVVISRPIIGTRHSNAHVKTRLRLVGCPEGS